MRIGRRGKHLAVRIPKDLVKQLSLQAGDEIDLFIGEKRELVISKRAPETSAKPNS